MDAGTIRGAIGSQLSGVSRGGALDPARTRKETFGSKLGQARPAAIGSSFAGPIVPGGNVLANALNGIFEGVAGGFDDVERTIVTNGDPALRAALLSDLQLVRRTLRSMQAKLGTISPRG